MWRPSWPRWTSASAFGNNSRPDSDGTFRWSNPSARKNAVMAGKNAHPTAGATMLITVYKALIIWRFDCTIVARREQARGNRGSTVKIAVKINYLLLRREPTALGSLWK